MRTGPPDEPNTALSKPPQLPLVEMPPPGTQFERLPPGTQFSKKRLLLCFAIAALSDCISIGATLAPPIQWIVDIATAFALFMVLGWHWLLLPGMIMEAIPGLGIFPTWVLVVAALAGWGSLKQPPTNQRALGPGPGQEYKP